MPLQALCLKNQFLVSLFDFKRELRHVLRLARARLAASVEGALGLAELAHKVSARIRWISGRLKGCELDSARRHILLERVDLASGSQLRGQSKKGPEKTRCVASCLVFDFVQALCKGSLAEFEILHNFSCSGVVGGWRLEAATSRSRRTYL